MKEKMKKAVIIYMWDRNSKNDLYYWLKKKLDEKRFDVIIQEMPNTSNSKINDWTSYLKKVVGNLDKNTFFVGHSIGC